MLISLKSSIDRRDSSCVHCYAVITSVAVFVVLHSYEIMRMDIDLGFLLLRVGRPETGIILLL